MLIFYCFREGKCLGGRGQTASALPPMEESQLRNVASGILKPQEKLDLCGEQNFNTSYSKTTFKNHNFSARLMLVPIYGVLLRIQGGWLFNWFLKLVPCIFEKS